MIGVLLTNLGTPSAPTTTAVRKYLAEFLSDPRVVEIPKLLWWPILHGLVLRLRPQRSAKLYQKIWTSNGSPLLVYSQRLAEKLQQKINCPVVLGMRYGEPSIKEALLKLKQKDIKKLIVLPLYPQYSAATTGSTFDAVTKVLKTWRHIPELHFITDYHNEPSYISALTEHIATSLRALHAVAERGNPNPDSYKQHHLLFSFHGLPKRCIDLGDPYQQQCVTTTELITSTLALPKENWSLAFQSRFGRAEWLQPYCDKTLMALPKQGIKNVSVVCPGFAVDCLETLEEINITNRELFLQVGGESFNYIPALNDSDAHVEMLVEIIKGDRRSPLHRDT